MESVGKMPLMRKGIAIWLVDNSSLTFKQIADFCGMHELEIQGIADGEISGNIMGQNPIVAGQISKEMLASCKKNPSKKLELKTQISDELHIERKKKGKYTPIARRSEKPDAILYLLKYFPDITDAQIRKLIGTTTNMINAIREKTHWNIKEIKPRDPVLLGLCSQTLFRSLMADMKKVVKEEEE
jgi:hypothetical protein